MVRIQGMPYFTLVKYIRNYLDIYSGFLKKGIPPNHPIFNRNFYYKRSISRYPHSSGLWTLAFLNKTTAVRELAGRNMRKASPTAAISQLPPAC
jgi:hypothetical protein